MTCFRQNKTLHTSCAFYSPMIDGAALPQRSFPIIAADTPIGEIFRFLSNQPSTLPNLGVKQSKP